MVLVLPPRAMKQYVRYFLCIIAACACVCLLFINVPYMQNISPSVYFYLTNSSSQLITNISARGSNIPTTTSTPIPPKTVSPQKTSSAKPSVTLTTPKPRPPRPVPKPFKRPPCYGGKVPKDRFDVYNKSEPLEVTVVTAYFNLGRFQKGSGGFFDTNLYMKWANVYQYIRSPFVFYTDSPETAEKFRKMRAGYENITKILLVERKAVWAFDYVERIKAIYSIPGYPKHHPNTVVPEYSCAQHAKYAVVEETVLKNYFNTTYFAWIDIGYFRYIVGRNKEFVIVKPADFNESRIALNKVYDVSMDVKVDNIFKGNRVWLGGGMFFGSKYTLPPFIADYRHAVERYLNMSLSSTDQQVIYSMNTIKEKPYVRRRVPIQAYSANIAGDCWFYLGFSCYRELS
ncbi:uncharacterized protein [Haliotis cracherodii]|uniref:uncharacterized protein isoform X1 n=2 Tax=Haliotis cracherodii TaxID=6455 RepID=UPI0039E84EA7